LRLSYQYLLLWGRIHMFLFPTLIFRLKQWLLFIYHGWTFVLCNLQLKEQDKAFDLNFCRQFLDLVDNDEGIFCMF
jgi:hypothetical protein